MFFLAQLMLLEVGCGRFFDHYGKFSLEIKGGRAFLV